MISEYRDPLEGWNIIGKDNEFSLKKSLFVMHLVFRPEWLLIWFSQTNSTNLLKLKFILQEMIFISIQ